MEADVDPLPAIAQMPRQQAREAYHGWVRRNFSGVPYAPLFDTETVERGGAEFQVVTKDRFGKNSRPVLARSDGMSEIIRTEMKLMIATNAFKQSEEHPQDYLDRKLPYVDFDWQILKKLRKAVTEGVDQRRIIKWNRGGDWSRTIVLNEGDRLQFNGFLYVMATLDDGTPVPRYIGICRLHNIGGQLNSLISHTAESKLGRWGYGRSQHLGELSAVLFDEGYEDWDPAPKYHRWADELFVDRTRVLSEAVIFMCQAWHEEKSLEEAERAIIALASRAYPDRMLNTEYHDDNW